MISQKEIQLGRKGITLEFIKDIENRLEKHRNITLKVSVLKSIRPEGKADVKKYADELVEKEVAPIGARGSARMKHQLSHQSYDASVNGSQYQSKRRSGLKSKKEVYMKYGW